MERTRDRSRGSVIRVAASGARVILSGTGCKLPADSQPICNGYAFKASIANPTEAPVTITITSLTFNGGPVGALTAVNLENCQTLGSTFTTPANTGYPNIAILTADNDSTNNGTLGVTYSVSGQSGTQVVSAIMWGSTRMPATPSRTTSRTA